MTKDSDRIKPVETLLSASLTNFAIVRTSITNLQQLDQPLILNYAFRSSGYGKKTGDLLLVRPRILGQKSTDVLETEDPRQFPLEFEGPLLDRDTFEITLPPGLEVGELPLPTDIDLSFASYHSKTESVGNTLRYTRSFEIKELSVPLNKMADLKHFYQLVAADERNTAVLKLSGVGK